MIGRGPILALLLALAWGMTQAATPPAKPSLDPRSLSYPPLEINFPKPATVQLDNGLIVYLFVDRELPLIDLFFYIKAGTIYDPEQKAGLSSVAMASLRTGGTRHMTPDEIDETLEFMPALAQDIAQDLEWKLVIVETIGAQMADRDAGLFERAIDDVHARPRRRLEGGDAGWGHLGVAPCVERLAQHLLHGGPVEIARNPHDHVVRPDVPAMKRHQVLALDGRERFLRLQTCPRALGAIDQ